MLFGAGFARFLFLIGTEMVSANSIEQDGRLAKLTELLDQLLLENGFELFDIEFKKGPRGTLVRVFLDKDGGITVEDCARISRELGSLIDVYELIDGKHTLEVSSPGLTRALKKPRDFQRVVGKTVKIKTRRDFDKNNVFLGKLVGFTDGIAFIDVEGKGFEIPFDSIKKANLEIEF